MDRETINYALSLLKNKTLSIDAEGRIWRHAIVTHGRRKEIAPRRAENPGGKGYLRITLQKDGRPVQVMAHRLVWEWTRGPIPDGLQINHKDLNKQNNHPDNLETVTGAQNIRHSYRNDRTIPWSKTRGGEWRPGCPLLSQERIDAIVAARASGAIYREIAEKFGVSITHAQRLCSKKGGGNGPTP